MWLKYNQKARRAAAPIGVAAREGRSRARAAAKAPAGSPTRSRRSMTRRPLRPRPESRGRQLRLGPNSAIAERDVLRRSGPAHQEGQIHAEYPVAGPVTQRARPATGSAADRLSAVSPVSRDQQDGAASRPRNALCLIAATAKPAEGSGKTFPIQRRRSGRPSPGRRVLALTPASISRRTPRSRP